MVFLIDISNLDSHLFEMLSQTSDNLYIYMADLERDFSRWSKSSVDYFNLPGEYIADTANEWVKHIHPQDQHIFFLIIWLCQGHGGIKVQKVFPIGGKG